MVFSKSGTIIKSKDTKGFKGKIYFGKVRDVI